MDGKWCAMDGPPNGPSHECGPTAEQLRRLCVPWPEVQRETTMSCYGGKRLPKAKCTATQWLPVFSECLKEATRSWNNPFSAKNPAQKGSARTQPKGGRTQPKGGLRWIGLTWRAADSPVCPLFSCLWALSSTLHRGVWWLHRSIPSNSKVDGFQSYMIEQCYKAALSVRSLNALTLLMSYQAKLEEDMTSTPWD